MRLGLRRLLTGRQPARTVQHARTGRQPRSTGTAEGGERPARILGCYSSGVLYSVPGMDQPAAELTPVCSETIQESIPPFGSRQFPVTRGGNSHFSLTTRGDAIVLQMLRPASATVKVYRVDSTIAFGKEAPGK